MRMQEKVPSRATCLELMQKYAMLDNIKEHSFVVARVAETLHNLLRNSSKSCSLPPIQLVTAGALLHDIGKTYCLKNDCDHAEYGSQICRDIGFPDVAEIVAEHVLLLSYEPERYGEGNFLAKELVNYADKRVLHDRIVNLEQRSEYIQERYGKGDPLRLQVISENFSKCVELEKWLCHFAERGADALFADLPYSYIHPSQGKMGSQRIVHGNVMLIGIVFLVSMQRSAD